MRRRVMAPACRTRCLAQASRLSSCTAASFRLILRDMRGHNGVETGNLDGYGFETTEFDDLLAVLEAEGIERTHLVGHSSGGATAFAFARRYPEHVRRLVLFEPTLVRLLPAEILTQQLSEHAELKAAAEREGFWAAFDQMYRKLVGPDWETRLPPAVVAQMRASTAIMPAHGDALYALDVNAEDILNLALPTLLFYAGRSFDWERHISARFGELRPDIQQILIEDAGHNMHLQRSERINAALLEFLSAPEL